MFRDTNHNGVYNGGEAGISGVLLTLLDSGGSVVATTTSAPDGSYSFDTLQPGNYRVVETQPVGYASSSSNTLNVTVALAIVNKQNFGETTSSLDGSVYVDTNGDGSRNATEPGISGVQVRLIGVDARGVPVSLTTTTDADGAYSFGGLLAGTYSVLETQPASFVDGLDAIGDAGGVVGNDVLSAITLGAGVDGSNYLFGEQPVPISGTVYKDRNHDATLNGGEPGIAGVTIVLKDSNGAVLASTVTAADGSYKFVVPPGSYTLVETQPTGYGSSTPNTQSITVPAGGLPNQDFGETASSLSGSAYLDLNSNSARDGNEPGLGGVLITLTGTDARGNPVNMSTTTAANGSYTFDDLLSGTYTLHETQPIALADGGDALGTAGGSLSNDTASGIVLPIGVDATGYLFGEQGVSLTGTVYHDRSRDGQLDAGELGIGQVILTLLDSNGGVVATTTTAADGTYAFKNLPPGNYTVVETQPKVYGSSTPNQMDVTLSGAGGATVNFGETSASLAGSVYVDANDNGKRNVGEPGITGVTVTLTGTDLNGQAVQHGTTTAADGSYSFDDLPAGTYSVHENQPTHFADGKDAAGTAGGVAGNDTITAVMLPGGAAGIQYLFGEQSATLTGHLFFDIDGDGIQEPGEPNLPNISIIVTDSSGKPMTVVTDANGTYIVVVAPGSVTVTVVTTDPDIPNGAAVTTDSKGGTASQTVTVKPNTNTIVSNVGFSLHTTAVVLARFTATQSDGGVVVEWETSAEINTWGFHLYRSADGVRAHAVRVTAALMPAQGRGSGGAAYAWTDLDADPRQRYTYWLQEIEVSGAVQEYGPATIAGVPALSTYQVFVPLAQR